MTSLSYSLDRTSLGLDPLIVSDTASAPYWLSGTDGEVAEPDFVFRTTYAPDAVHVPGKQLLAAVLDQSTLPLVVFVQGTSSADLATKRADLTAALAQFAFTVTQTLDGATTTWAADPSTPSWGALSYSMQSTLWARAVLTIPVNPA